VQQPRYRPAQTLPHGDAALQQEGANLIDDAGMNRPAQADHGRNRSRLA
jgi:hypothetical protein